MSCIRANHLNECLTLGQGQASPQKLQSANIPRLALWLTQWNMEYLLNNRPLERAMTNLDENVVPVFRRALVNGKSQGGAWHKGQTNPRTYKQAQNSNQQQKTHKVLFPLCVATGPRQI